MALDYYPWLKALHIAFMVTWFAGLFYLPRLFIYHAQAADDLGRRRFTVMEKRLYAIMTVGGVLTAVLGLLLLWLNPSLLSHGWLHAKLALVAGLVAYHVSCRWWIRRLERTSEPQPARGLRWFNEIPALFLLAIVLLAVLKPEL
ncbi:MAG TPA: CopD family protein [Woeseiaceae bacterium]|nr:CopD family protein [Woeseiaceae bacterium]